MKRNSPKSKKTLRQVQVSSTKAASPKRLITPFARVTTGIEGLDMILHGGFLQGGTYLILGAPGTGKTVLANQICFHQMTLKRRAVYVTLLAESHTRMFGNLKTFDFFDDGRISSDIQYMSGYSVLEKEGLDGLLRLLRDLVVQHKAHVLFIDGIASADALAGSPEQFKKFVHHLNSVLGIAGCTSFLLSSAEGEQSKPEYTMVDGILYLNFFRQGLQTARQIEVRKFRGSAHFYGRHFFEIIEQGIAVYPRLEASIDPERPAVPFGQKRLPFGLPDIDAMIDGGLVLGSFTTMLGPAGTGKTQIGMQFLRHGAEVGEPSMLMSFYESSERVEEKLKRMDRSVKKAVEGGALTILRPQTDCRLIDKTFHRLLKEIRARGIKRLFIEGVNGLRQGMFEQDRLVPVLSALVRELHGLGVTTLLTEESLSFQPQSGSSICDESAITDNTFEFRHVDLEGQRRETFCVMKTRESAHDSSIRLVEFTNKGIRLGGAVEYTTSYLPVVKRKMI